MSDPEFEETMPLPRGGVPTEQAGAPGSVPRPPSQPTDLVGKQLGDFKVLRRLGSGAMAEVFLAEQVSLRRQVALKILKPELVQESDDTHIKRFKQEATAAANLNHPHIVQVYAIGEADGVHYIAQEYVPGLTLREWLRKNGPPEPLLAIRMVRQVALALQAAAEAGIVHRDIKPENVLLTKRREVKVADFGLAQLGQTGERVHLTQVGMTMGTPLYMSPEQVAGKPLDHRSDIYSLGVTAYQVLAGVPPFRGETALSVAVQHLNSDPEPLRKVRPDLPVALGELVEKMMDKRPEHRYQTAAELAEDLRALGVALKVDPQSAAKKNLGAFTVAKDAPATPSAWPLGLDRFFDWSGRKHAVALASVAALLLLLSAGIGWATRPPDPFDSEPPPQGIKKAQSARDQYYAAGVAGTAEAWQAVRDYWPDDEVWRPVATLRLALLRLSERDIAGAEQLFRELSTSKDDWAEVNGYAGLAVIAAIENRPEEFRDIFGNQLLTQHNWYEVGSRLHSDVRQLLQGVRERRKFDAQTQVDLNRLLDETTSADGNDGRNGGQAGPPSQQ